MALGPAFFSVLLVTVPLFPPESMTAPPTLLTQQVCFGGKVEFYQHASSACNGDMKFAVYQPPQAKSEAVPVLYLDRKSVV